MAALYRGPMFSRLSAAAVWLVTLSFAFCAREARAIEILLTRVGNAGNKADPTVMVTDTTSGYGSVSYSYSIGIQDVTLGQYAAFLTSVAKADPYGLYNSTLGSGDHIKGIKRSGASGAYTYAVIGNPQDPVTYVTWLDAARFCNWLENGQPATGKEEAGTTETGAYNLSGNTGLETKTNGAVWWIPTENEWYKAAYYDPTKGGTGGYWTYPTRANTIPGNDYKTPAVASQANFINAAGLFSVTQNATESGTQNYLTPVESFTKSPSYYGTYDQGGDVYQWNDAIIGKSRGTRGGSWDLGSSYMLSNARDSRAPTGANPGIGFRVASSRLPVPIITSGPKATGTDGVAFKYQIAASNATSFNATNLAAEGLTFSASTGLISGTPSKTGTFVPVISGINSSGTGSATLTLVIAAKPAAEGASAATGSGGSTLTETGVTLTANSVTTIPFVVAESPDFAGLAGSYDGLATVGGTGVGLFTISLTSNGAFTGKLVVSGTSYPLAGTFSAGGTYVLNPNAGSETPGVALILKSAPAGIGGLFVPDAAGVESYSIQSSAAGAFTAATLPAGLAGTYTAALPAIGGTAGSATFSVATTGAIKIAGTLGDGTPFTGASQLDADGKTWTLFIPLDGGARPGSIAGTMTFESSTDSNCDGTVDWIKPAQAADPGFSTSFQLKGLKTPSP